MILANFFIIFLLTAAGSALRPHHTPKFPPKLDPAYHGIDQSRNERGGGDRTYKGYLTLPKEEKYKQAPIRGGFTGKPQKVKIGKTIYGKKDHDIIKRSVVMDKIIDTNETRGNKVTKSENVKFVTLNKSQSEDILKASEEKKILSTSTENVKKEPKKEMNSINMMDNMYIDYESEVTSTKSTPKNNNTSFSTQSNTNNSMQKQSTNIKKSKPETLKLNEYEDIIPENDTWRVAFAGGGNKKKVDLSFHGSKSIEHKLFEYIFEGYNKNLRPTVYGGEITHVLFELSLFDILLMDTKKRQIIINTEMIMKWQEFHLAWDPKDYGGVSHIRVPFYDIWFPDVILHNTADSDYESSILNTYAIIKYTGEVELLSHALFLSVCELDVTWYPFDQQVCELKFASWSYDIEGIILDKGPALLNDFNENPEFGVENFWATSYEQFNPCCPNPFSAVIYSIQLQRRVNFPMFFYIMPGILINICAILVFSLPAETGEKVGLGINSMLAMIVFLMAMTENLPPTQQIPLAGMFYGVALGLITLNISLSIYVLNLNFSGFRGTPIPEWVKTTSLVFAKIQQIRIPIIVRKNWHYENDEDKKKRFPLNLITIERRQPDPDGCPYHDHSPKKDVEEEPFVEPPIVDRFERRCVDAFETLVRIKKKREERRVVNEKEYGLVEEWKFISRVLDRCLFIIFIVVVSGFNINILTSSPFLEANEYCPYGKDMCEGMTREEIDALDINEIIHAAHAAGGQVETAGEEIAGGGGHGAKGGGHGAPAKGHGDPAPAKGHGGSKGH